MRLILLSILLAFCSASAAARPRAIQDCRDCPRMIVLPAGDFLLGSPDTEPERYPNEGPQQKMRVAGFAIGETEVTRGQFARFIAATHRPMTRGCYTPGDLKDLLSDLEPGASWRAPGYRQSDDHPVVCVSWDDAKAYAAWLSGETGQHYRLPTEAEWEYAARAGTSSPYFWGADASRECAHINGGDLSLGRALPLWAKRTREAFDQGERHSVLIQCEDGSPFTSRVKRYRPNAFGLYDIIGNVWEWVEDCAGQGGYQAPGPDGAAAEVPNCKRRRTRGGSWDDWPVDLRSAVRKRLDPAYRRSDTGFRIVRELGSTQG